MHHICHPLLFSVLFSAVYAVAINQPNNTYQTLEQVNKDLPSIPKHDTLTDEIYDDDYYSELALERARAKNNIEYEYDMLNDTANSTDYYYYEEIEQVKNPKQQKCQMCTIRDEQKRHRVEAIKNRISHVLKLDVLGMPNTTAKRLPKVPSFLRLREKYENAQMQSDSPNSRKEEKLRYQDVQEEYGQPERTYSFARELPAEMDQQFPNTIYFDMQDSPEKETNKALLWVYISPDDIIDRNMTEIYVYTIDPPGKFSKVPTKREIGRRKRHYMKASGWHHFDILDEVQKWTYRTHLNLGLVVEALDETGHNLVVLPPTFGDDDGYEPMLDLRTSLRKSTRSKRSTELYCDTREETACCRYPLEVDFVAFGWDFVIAPLTYAAYYCAGECKGEQLDDTLHAHVIQQAPSPTLSQPQSAISNVGPCCTPTKMSDLAMLFFDHNSNIALTRLPRMKVDRCGCA
ncbi:growth/differentiation factor 8-like [Argopecten irradians]|uniref:Myostatin n=2 Tax=Argopecten irradians TaxID=31199 RepID=E3TTZ7_ARGIR|nr:myostatin [Argopecten irradians]ADO32801.1 myostatin [Argopecten irradians]